MKTTVLYYGVEGMLDSDFEFAVRKNLIAAAGNRPIVWAIQPRGKELSYKSAFENMLGGLKQVETKYVALAEHDVLYPALHFDHIPNADIEYDKARYRLLADEGVFSFRPGRAMSTAIAKTEAMRKHVEQRLDNPDSFPPKSQRWEPEGDEDKLFGTDGITVGYFRSIRPVVDVVNHGKNLTHRKTAKKPTTILRGWGDAKDVINNYRVPSPLREKTGRGKDAMLEFPVAPMPAPGVGLFTMRVESIWLRRLGIADPLKRQRIAFMFDSFLEIAEAVSAGRKYRFKDARKTDYFRYLKTHDLGVRSDKKLFRKNFESGARLVENIKENGLLYPIEAYVENGNFVLFRGYRRIVALKALGAETTFVLIHTSRKAALAFPLNSRVPLGKAVCK